MRILLIEDDTAIGGAVREHATDGSHAVDWAKSLSAARDYADVATYGLVLLDLHLPDGNGISYLREMRRRFDETPVIILTAHDQISDRIEGLNAGADDYLVKPFDLGELSARIHAVIRRYGHHPEPSLTFGFKRGNSGAVGPGLGLAITEMLVRQMGGTLDFASPAGGREVRSDRATFLMGRHGRVHLVATG